MQKPFRVLGSKLVLQFQLVLRNRQGEVPEEMAAHLISVTVIAKEN
jgi:hypothetical protein